MNIKMSKPIMCKILRNSRYKGIYTYKNFAYIFDAYRAVKFLPSMIDTSDTDVSVFEVNYFDMENKIKIIDNLMNISDGNTYCISKSKLSEKVKGHKKVYLKLSNTYVNARWLLDLLKLVNVKNIVVTVDTNDVKKPILIKHNDYSTSILMPVWHQGTDKTPIIEVEEVLKED